MGRGKGRGIGIGIAIGIGIGMGRGIGIGRGAGIGCMRGFCSTRVCFFLDSRAVFPSRVGGRFPDSGLFFSTPLFFPDSFSRFGPAPEGRGRGVGGRGRGTAEAVWMLDVWRARNAEEHTVEGEGGGGSP